MPNKFHRFKGGPTNFIAGVYFPPEKGSYGSAGYIQAREKYGPKISPAQNGPCSILPVSLDLDSGDILSAATHEGALRDLDR